MSSAEKPETGSEKAKEKVTGPAAMPLTLSLIAREGGWVSSLKDCLGEAAPSLPAAVRTRALIEKALPAVAARTGVNAQVSLRLFTLAVPSRALLLKTWMVSPRASLTGRVPLMVGVRSLVWPPLGINPAALETAVMTGLPMRC